MVDVSGDGTSADPWVISQAATEMTISDAGTTSATMTSNTANTTYTLSYSSSGNIDLDFDGKTQEDVDVESQSALETAIETLTGMDATVASSGSDEWTVTLAIKAITANLSNVELVTGISVGIDDGRQTVRKSKYRYRQRVGNRSR